jgi:RNA methyltransferase, TrmH family
VHIPMSGGAESLNVAAAAAICLYQSAQALGVLRPR